MTTQQITPENAPRDAEQLSKIGRFHMRTLADQLGVFATNEGKTAFMALSPEGMGQELLRLLTEVDKAKGKASAAGVRNPVTSKSKGQSAAAGKSGGESATATAGGGTQAAGAAVPGSEKLLALISAQGEAIKELGAQLAALKESVDSASDAIAGSNRLAQLGIVVSLTIAEEFLKAPREQVLETASDDMASLEAQLQQAWGTGGGEEEEEEEESAEGEE